jgi:hypothetical protein
MGGGSQGIPRQRPKARTLVRTSCTERYGVSAFSMDCGASLRRARTLQRLNPEQARGMSEVERSSLQQAGMSEAERSSLQQAGMSEAERSLDGVVPLPRVRGFSTGERARGMSEAERPASMPTLDGGLTKSRSRGLGRASVVLRQVC